MTRQSLTVISTPVTISTTEPITKSWRSNPRHRGCGGGGGGRLTESNAVQLGLILATITVAFLVTTLPMTVVVIVKAFYESLSSPGDAIDVLPSTDVDGHSSRYMDRRVDDDARRGLARLVCELLMYTNHSINFFLYCAAGEKFRRELAVIGRRLRRCLVVPLANAVGGSGALTSASTGQRDRRHAITNAQEMTTAAAFVDNQTNALLMPPPFSR